MPLPSLDFPKTDTFAAGLRDRNVTLRVYVGAEFTVGGRRYRFSAADGTVARSDRSEMGLFRRFASSVSDFFCNRVFDGSVAGLTSRLGKTRSARLAVLVPQEAGRFRHALPHASHRSADVGAFARVLAEYALLVENKTFAELREMGCQFQGVSWTDLIAARVNMHGTSAADLIAAGVDVHDVSWLTLAEHHVALGRASFASLKGAGVLLHGAPLENVNVTGVPIGVLVEAGFVLGNGSAQKLVDARVDLEHETLETLDQRGFTCKDVSFRALIALNVDLKGAKLDQIGSVQGVEFNQLLQEKVNLEGRTFDELHTAGVRFVDVKLQDLINAKVNVNGVRFADLKDLGVNVRGHTLKQLVEAGIVLEGVSRLQLLDAKMLIPMKLDYKWAVAVKALPIGMRFRDLRGLDHVPVQDLLDHHVSLHQVEFEALVQAKVVFTPIHLGVLFKEGVLFYNATQMSRRREVEALGIKNPSVMFRLGPLQTQHVRELDKHKIDMRRMDVAELLDRKINLKGCLVEELEQFGLVLTGVPRDRLEAEGVVFNDAPADRVEGEAEPPDAPVPELKPSDEN